MLLAHVFCPLVIAIMGENDGQRFIAEMDRTGRGHSLGDTLLLALWPDKKHCVSREKQSNGKHKDELFDYVVTQFTRNRINDQKGKHNLNVDRDETIVFRAKFGPAMRCVR